LEGNGRGRIHVLSPLYLKSTVHPRKIVGVRADVVRHFPRRDRLSQLAGNSSQTQESRHTDQHIACLCCCCYQDGLWGPPSITGGRATETWCWLFTFIYPRS